MHGWDDGGSPARPRVRLPPTKILDPRTFEENEVLKARNAALEDELRRAKTQQHATQQELADADNTISKLRKQSMIDEAQHRAANLKLAALETAISTLEEAAKASKVQLATSHTKLAELQENVTNLRRSVTAHKKQNNILLNSYQKLRAIAKEEGDRLATTESIMRSCRRTSTDTSDPKSSSSPSS